ncbi:hypothetical protein J6590_106234, partial [Homalodisca vitripennis]
MLWTLNPDNVIGEQHLIPLWDIDKFKWPESCFRGKYALSAFLVTKVLEDVHKLNFAIPDDTQQAERHSLQK